MSEPDTEHTECAVCGYEPDPERVPPHYVLSLSDEHADDEIVQSYPFGGSLSVPFACSDECWLDAQDDPELVTDGGAEQTATYQIDPDTASVGDYLDAIEGGETALHVYMKDDKQWWLAHDPDGELIAKLHSREVVAECQDSSWIRVEKVGEAV